MSRSDTVRRGLAASCAGQAKIALAASTIVLTLASAGFGQTPTVSGQTKPDWRSVGNFSIESAVPVGYSGGPVSRVWFSDDGLKLYARLRNGRTVETEDFETWKLATNAPLPGKNWLAAKDWNALTEFKGVSIIGTAPVDATISPADKDDLVVANAFGIWRSLDGGDSWVGLNEGLPNFPGMRFVGEPGGDAGLHVLLSDNIREAIWRPGERKAWRVMLSESAFREADWAERLTQSLNVRTDRVAVNGSYFYAGIGDAILVSPDGRQSWRPTKFAGAEPGSMVREILMLPDNPQMAVAVLGGAGGTRVVRTMNGGLFWDDITANLPAGRVNGVSADLETGTIYVASDTGLYTAVTNLRAADGAAPAWTRIDTGSDAAVLDVTLGLEGHQLWILLDGIGVRRTMAPHRARSPKVVSGADGLSRQTAAPGGLLSVLGARVAQARVGTVEVPVLSANDAESQLQLPYSLQGGAVTLALGNRSVDLTLRETAPAIVTDPDGTPLLLDADRGALIDTMMPARAGTTIQILATGLGKVTPDWPAGTPAPADNTPKVAAPVKAWLDKVPVEVTRATLAPGYAGLYLIELEIPQLVNLGPNELYLETGNNASNHVTLHIGR